MLVVRVGSLTGNVVTQLDQVPGELAKTANDQCNITPLYAIRLHLSVHRAVGAPSAQVLGVLFKAPLNALSPFFNRNVSLRLCLQFAEVPIAVKRVRRLARRKRAVEHQVRVEALEVPIVKVYEVLENAMCECSLCRGFWAA